MRAAAKQRDFLTSRIAGYRGRPKAPAPGRPPEHIRGYDRRFLYRFGLNRAEKRCRATDGLWLRGLPLEGRPDGLIRAPPGMADGQPLHDGVETFPPDVAGVLAKPK